MHTSLHDVACWFEMKSAYDILQSLYDDLGPESMFDAINEIHGNKVIRLTCAECSVESPVYHKASCSKLFPKEPISFDGIYVRE